MTSFSISIYRLMIANMTNTEYIPISLENIVSLLPLVVHLNCKDKLEKAILEPLANFICLFLLVIMFYAHVSFLSMQYLARNPDKRFWTLT